jgi:predicted RNA binding protein YcfA (HicA-like mRNA interferase family)
VIRELLRLGGQELRQKGSHRFFVSACGKCKTPVADHSSQDIPRGTLAKIERSMAPCLGEKWLTRSK